MDNSLMGDLFAQDPEQGLITGGDSKPRVMLSAYPGSKNKSVLVKVQNGDLSELLEQFKGKFIKKVGGYKVPTDNEYLLDSGFKELMEEGSITYANSFRLPIELELGGVFTTPFGETYKVVGTDFLGREPTVQLELENTHKEIMVVRRNLRLKDFQVAYHLDIENWDQFMADQRALAQIDQDATDDQTAHSRFSDSAKERELLTELAELRASTKPFVGLGIEYTGESLAKVRERLSDWVASVEQIMEDILSNGIKAVSQYDLELHYENNPELALRRRFNRALENYARHAGSLAALEYYDGESAPSSQDIIDSLSTWHDQDMALKMMERIRYGALVAASELRSGDAITLAPKDAVAPSTTTNSWNYPRSSAFQHEDQEYVAHGRITGGAFSSILLHQITSLEDYPEALPNQAVGFAPEQNNLGVVITANDDSYVVVGRSVAYPFSQSVYQGIYESLSDYLDGDVDHEADSELAYGEFIRGLTDKPHVAETLSLGDIEVSKVGHGSFLIQGEDLNLTVKGENNLSNILVHGFEMISSTGLVAEVVQDQVIEESGEAEEPSVAEQEKESVLEQEEATSIQETVDHYQDFQREFEGFKSRVEALDGQGAAALGMWEEEKITSDNLEKILASLEAKSGKVNQASDITVEYYKKAILVKGEKGTRALKDELGRNGIGGKFNRTLKGWVFKRDSEEQLLSLLEAKSPGFKNKLEAQPEQSSELDRSEEQSGKKPADQLAPEKKTNLKALSDDPVPIGFKSIGLNSKGQEVFQSKESGNRRILGHDKEVSLAALMSSGNQDYLTDSELQAKPNDEMVVPPILMSSYLSGEELVPASPEELLAADIQPPSEIGVEETKPGYPEGFTFYKSEKDGCCGEITLSNGSAVATVFEKTDGTALVCYEIGTASCVRSAESLDACYELARRQLKVHADCPEGFQLFSESIDDRKTADRFLGAITQVFNGMKISLVSKVDGEGVLAKIHDGHQWSQPYEAATVSEGWDNATRTVKSLQRDLSALPQAFTDNTTVAQREALNHLVEAYMEQGGCSILILSEKLKNTVILQPNETQSGALYAVNSDGVCRALPEKTQHEVETFLSNYTPMLTHQVMGGISDDVDHEAELERSLQSMSL